MAWKLSSDSTDSESSNPRQPDPVVAAARVGREVLGPRGLAATDGTPATQAAVVQAVQPSGQLAEILRANVGAPVHALFAELGNSTGILHDGQLADPLVHCLGDARLTTSMSAEVCCWA